MPSHYLSSSENVLLIDKYILFNLFQSWMTSKIDI